MTSWTSRGIRAKTCGMFRASLSAGTTTDTEGNTISSFPPNITMAIMLLMSVDLRRISRHFLSCATPEKADTTKRAKGVLGGGKSAQAQRRTHWRTDPGLNGVAQAAPASLMSPPEVKPAATLAPRREPPPACNCAAIHRLNLSAIRVMQGPWPGPYAHLTCMQCHKSSRHPSKQEHCVRKVLPRAPGRRDVCLFRNRTTARLRMTASGRRSVNAAPGTRRTGTRRGPPPVVNPVVRGVGVPVDKRP